jgi:AcrR family transcriptional regulator
VVAAAVDLVDADGLEALTMRALAGRLEVKPMSLYRHVASKDELLDALVERLYSEMERPDPSRNDWRAELRRRSASVRSVLVRHPWSLALLETRAGPDRPFTFEHAEAVLATLLAAGFEPVLASRAFVVIDAFVYGFAVQEVSMPSTDPHSEGTAELAEALGRYPSMAAVMTAVTADPDYDFLAEFDPCLDLVLDGVERWRDASREAPGSR